MAKGYWIGHVDIHNMDGYRAYIEGNVVVFDTCLLYTSPSPRD